MSHAYVLTRVLAKFATSGSRLAVPALHRYGHNASCQEINHVRVLDGFVLEDLETCERVVSPYLSPPRPILEWAVVVEYAFVSQFKLLQDCREDVSR